MRSDLEQAVDLYRRAFLDRIQLPDSAAFEAWVMLNRLASQSCWLI